MRFLRYPMIRREQQCFIVPCFTNAIAFNFLLSRMYLGHKIVASLSVDSVLVLRKKNFNTKKVKHKKHEVQKVLKKVAFA